ncbi:hypothetical protein EVAR_84537_1 [Eumeta japonica]|uniref:Uncharacterized protein n=1 Tax=Eumeta variegata TaxID=151549 RepID=A0A4C1UHS6_EUMVA|nr:hypothetical protein EVAR_84537_1 [Eumeta japonica]
MPAAQYIEPRTRQIKGRNNEMQFDGARVMSGQGTGQSFLSADPAPGLSTGNVFSFIPETLNAPNALIMRNRALRNDHITSALCGWNPTDLALVNSDVDVATPLTIYVKIGRQLQLLKLILILIKQLMETEKKYLYINWYVLGIRMSRVQKICMHTCSECSRALHRWIPHDSKRPLNTSLWKTGPTAFYNDPKECKSV